FIAAGTLDCGFMIFRMDSLFHFIHLLCPDCISNQSSFTHNGYYIREANTFQGEFPEKNPSFRHKLPILWYIVPEGNCPLPLVRTVPKEPSSM
ncbi:MAG TPA: hypothetical protein VFK33_08570, partial [Bacillales bacterium]|nr:hypothetical protein [Bacillales bacterium]